MPGESTILPNLPINLLLDPLHLLSLGFGSGLMPLAPGSFGTLLAILPYLFIARLPLPIYLLAVLTCFGSGIFLCQYTSTVLGVHDHMSIVWDEFVGFWVTMIAAPPSWKWILPGFVLFRVFDLVKPWPVNIADTQLEGGLGIMLDDLLAGLYAMACLQLLLLFFRITADRP